MKVATPSKRVLGPVVFGGLSCLLTLLTATTGHAAEYYVDTKGSDSNAGTLDQPFASLQKGHDVAVAGDTVWIRGGTYKIVNGKSDMCGIQLSKSGQSDAKRIKFWAYKDELPIFDFTSLNLSKTKTSAGIYVTGSWLHLKGFEVHHVPMPGTVSNNGIWTVGGSNNTYEMLNLHHNSGPGLSIANGNGGHLILNTDSHDNYDANAAQGAGQNADGFGVHYQASGPSTVFRGCRAWWNSDDGYDLISQEVSVTFQNSWAMGNGYINSGASRPSSGNGNGFKAGSSKTGVRHIIENCLAWKNSAAGFYANHSSGGNTWYNNTAYNNGVAFNMLASNPGDSSSTITLTGDKAHKMRNNIGFPDKNTNMNGVDSKSNTWDLMITPSANDFVSVMDTGYMGPRLPDGSLPTLDFMKLKAGSQMIDKGVDVGLPAVGASPDLGAYEYGAAAVGSGGAAGAGTTTGGSGGAGGAGTTGTGGAGGVSVTGTGGATGSGGATATTGSGGNSTTSGGNAGSGNAGSTDPGTGGSGVTTTGTETTGGATTGSNGSGGSASTGAGGGAAGQAATPAAPGNEAGCACGIVGARTSGSFVPLLSGLVALVARAGRRRARSRTAA